MYTLGINAAYHDSAACLVRDGLVAAAAEEERFTQVKHAKRPVPFSAWELPFHAIHYCLASQGLRLDDVDHVAYSYDPALFPCPRTARETIELPLEPSKAGSQQPGTSPWDPLFLSYIVNAPRQLVDGAPHHLKDRFAAAGHRHHFRWHSVQHHLAHAASAFLASPFREAAIMTLDGRGEQSTTSYAFGSSARIDILGSVDMPHSLGLLYERITTHLGFLHSSDEYKVMALASFGKPAFRKEFEALVAVGNDGAYRIGEADLEGMFGPARQRTAPFEARHYDIACSLQAVLQDAVLGLAQWLHRRTGTQSLCMAGGVALNCVLNSVLLERGPFKNIWVQPAAGDAGTALGAAMLVDGQERGGAERAFRMDHAYFGPEYADQEIEEFLRSAGLRYRKMTDIAGEVSELLAREQVIGWFQGRMEFGPRALGSRSILASPLHASMQARLNEIKDREDFRPVAPVVLEEEAPAWFSGVHPSPFMLFVHRVRGEQADRIPAVRHVDGTARIQTVNRAQNPLYYDLIRAFCRRTGVPVLVNTSFNTRGRPIVCTPRDAVECFYTSPLDALAIGSFLIRKEGAPA